MRWKSVIVFLLSFSVLFSIESTAFADGYLLTEPEAYRLRIPSEMFADLARRTKLNPKEFLEQRKLPKGRKLDLTKCHTQGVAIVKGDLFISCCLYDASRKEIRSVVGHSLVLRTSLSEILRRSVSIRWTVKDITQFAPEAERARLLQKLPGLKALNYRLTHPSGLVYDYERDRIWLANAIYAPFSFSRYLGIDPASMTIDDLLTIRDHIGTLVLLNPRYLLGLTWGSADMSLVDLERRESVDVPASLSLEPGVEYQDCASLDGNQFLCGGNEKSTVTEFVDGAKRTVKVRKGRLRLFQTSQASRQLNIEYLSDIAADFGDGDATTVLGLRKYYSIGKDRDLHPNLYGTYRSWRTLTNNGLGFAVHQDEEFLYFLPDDLPDGRLIRMQLERR